MMFLLIVTLSSMVLAAIMSLVAWRMAAEERRRSEARVAALAEEIHAPIAAASAVQPQAAYREDAGMRAEPARLASFASARRAPRWDDAIHDLPLRPERSASAASRPAMYPKVIAGPMVDVQLGPAGVQWCSKPLLEAVAENSAQTGRRIHMHLLETIYQRAWADRHFPDGIVRYLRDIGLLSERLTLAHCIHARPDDIEMIAASGARIVTNFSSNLHLRSGLAPIAAAHKCGCAIAVGVDGLALDEDDDVLREMRLVQMMHGGLGFKRNWTCSEFLALAVANGRKATGAPGTGELTPGAPADFVTIDLDRLDCDQIMPVDPIDLLFARGNASLLRDVVVDGRLIVNEGRCTGVDLPAIEHELRGIYRANAGRLTPFQQAWPPLSASLQNWFEARFDCR